MAEQKVVCECGQKVRASDSLTGKTIKCPKCAQPLRIPGPAAAFGNSTKPSNQATESAQIKVLCSCGTKIAVNASLAGKRIKCPKCGQGVRVAGDAVKPGKDAPSPIRSKAASTISDILDEVGLEATQTGQRCPSCRADLSPGQLICVKCGYHLETRKKLEVTKYLDQPKRHPYSDERRDQDQTAAKDRPLHPKVSSLASLLSLLMALWLVCVVIYVGFIAFVTYQEFDEASSLGSNLLAVALPGILLLLPAVLFGYTARLVKDGRRAGRSIAVIIGCLSLLGFPCMTVLGVFILINAFSYEVQDHCR